MAGARSGKAMRLVLGLLAALLAALLSRFLVSRFWTFVPGDFPESWPWGPPVTPENARLFEEVMGLLVLGLLLVAFSELVLAPWLRERLDRRS